MYWEMVLNEVLRRDKVQSFNFTNHGCLGMAEDEEKLRVMRSTQKARVRNEYGLGKKHPNVHFSQREAECMLLLLKGMLVREAAEELALSVRTAEYYVLNMRAKLGCQTKAELLDLVAKSSFLALLESTELANRI